MVQVRKGAGEQVRKRAGMHVGRGAGVMDEGARSACPSAHLHTGPSAYNKARVVKVHENIF